jgi:hypothetical protein
MLTNQTTGTTQGHKQPVLCKRQCLQASTLPSQNSRSCRKPPRYGPYKGTYVLYDGTYGMPYQGQTLDVQEGQTAESALRDDWTRNVPHHTLEAVLEVILEHMCTGLRP